jgi:flagellar biosynthetic protein FliR
MFASGEIAAWIGSFLWPLARVLGVFAVAPVVGTRIVPSRVRLGLGVMVTLLIAPLLPPVVLPDNMLPTTIAVLTQQVLIGIAIGLSFRVVFSAMQLGAQVIALQMGLGFAELVDPQNGTNTPTLSQFYLLIGTLVFLSLDGHHMLIILLVESFELLPVGINGLGTKGMHALVAFGGAMFSGAVLVALPATAALVCVNVVMGVMTRAVPQFNMFVAFPALLLLGMLTIVVSLPSLPSQLTGMVDEAVQTTRTKILGGG